MADAQDAKAAKVVKFKLTSGENKDVYLWEDGDGFHWGQFRNGGVYETSDTREIEALRKLKDRGVSEAK